VTTGFITTSFPRYVGDFAGCFVEDSVNEAIRIGQDVEVIAAGAPHAGRAIRFADSKRVPLGRFDGRLDSPAQDRSDLGPRIRVFRVAMPVVPDDARLFFGAGAPETLESGAALAWAQAAFFWAGLCNRIRERAATWDRIVAHWLVPCALAARTAARHLSVTAHAHSGDVALLERIPGGASLGRLLTREIDDLVFVSDDLRYRFARLTGVVAGRVAHAATRIERAQPWLRDRDARARARTRLGLDHRTILSAGRLVPIKGFDILVRAAALAAAGCGDHRAPPAIVILGEGPERGRLLALASRLNVNLRLPGCVPRFEVHDWMMGADLYVQPSRPLSSGRTEGLPVATLEAVRACLPVIASATGGLKELLGTPRVRLVPTEDVAALATCLASEQVS
jgi:glycosyltransferase involved in cell wall biosynthesis